MTNATPILEYISQVVGLAELMESGAFELPCDLGTKLDVECPNPARWVMWRKPCCEAAASPALACEGCKERRLMNHIAVICRHCGAVHMDSASAYMRIEAL